jgi:site-specific recombinase XerD
MTVVTLHDASATPLEHYTDTYLGFKRKRLTAKSERGYRAILQAFAAYYPTKEIEDFEPPTGSVLIEDFLTAKWGDSAPRTYNKSHSVLSNFFVHQVARGTLSRDPMLTIERAKARQVHRQTFTDDQRQRMLATNPYPREQIAIRLLFDYGVRKGALQNVQIKHFDRAHRRLTIFTKGEKIFDIPIVDEYVWRCLELLGEPGGHYLIPKQTQRRRKPPHRKQFDRAQTLLDELVETLVEVDDDACAREMGELAGLLGIVENWLDLTVGAASVQVRRYPAERMGEHGMHSIWYRWLARAGIVAPGTTSGSKMHAARHTAAQRLLEKTGNMRAVQALLCHSSMNTTENYVGWEIEQLAGSLREAAPAGDLSLSLHDRVREAGVRV